jgi:hypothetical protein
MKPLGQAFVERPAATRLEDWQWKLSALLRSLTSMKR